MASLQLVFGCRRRRVGRFTNGATTLTSPQAFSPWGEDLGTNGLANPLGYQQERADLPGGLVPMGVREYNPATNTFITHDPITDPRVPNGYSYTAANPLGGIDPTGRQECGCANDDLAVKIQEALDNTKAWWTKGSISPNSPLVKGAAAIAAGAAGTWIYNQFRGYFDSGARWGGFGEWLSWPDGGQGRSGGIAAGSGARASAAR